MVNFAYSNIGKEVIYVDKDDKLVHATIITTHNPGIMRLESTLTGFRFTANKNRIFFPEKIKMKPEELKEGDIVQVEGTQCIEQNGIREVYKDLGGRLYIACKWGRHFVDMWQKNEAGDAIGLKKIQIKGIKPDKLPDPTVKPVGRHWKPENGE